VCALWQLRRCSCHARVCVGGVCVCVCVSRVGACARVCEEQHLAPSAHRRCRRTPVCVRLSDDALCCWCIMLAVCVPSSCCVSRRTGHFALNLRSKQASVLSVMCHMALLRTNTHATQTHHGCVPDLPRPRTPPQHHCWVACGRPRMPGSEQPRHGSMLCKK
jgi:hypothetical protein